MHDKIEDRKKQLFLKILFPPQSSFDSRCRPESVLSVYKQTDTVLHITACYSLTADFEKCKKCESGPVLIVEKFGTFHGTFHRTFFSQNFSPNSVLIVKKLRTFYGTFTDHFWTRSFHCFT